MSWNSHLKPNCEFQRETVNKISSCLWLITMQHSKTCVISAIYSWHEQNRLPSWNYPALTYRRHTAFPLWHWRAGEMDVVEPIEAQPKQNTIRVVGQHHSRQQVMKAQMKCQTLTLGGIEIKFCTEVICLGVMFDPKLTFAIHIRQLAGKGFYHLRQV